MVLVLGLRLGRSTVRGRGYWCWFLGLASCGSSGFGCSLARITFAFIGLRETLRAHTLLESN